MAKKKITRFSSLARWAAKPSILQWLLLAGAITLAGCAVGPDYTPPHITMPDIWEQKLTKGLARGEADIHTWWNAFHDPILTQLINEAARSNEDIKTAFARVQEAQAFHRITTGEWWPDANAGGSIERSRTSKDYPVGTVAGHRVDTYYNYGLDASWEIDTWGRIARSVQSAGFDLQASIADYRDTMVLLLAEVAVSYVEIRALQDRISLAESNIRIQRATLQLTKARYESELAPQLDVRQAELNLATTESVLPDLRAQLGRTMNRLAVLLGKHPRAIHLQLDKTAHIPKLPAKILVGLPMELLRQRPDVRRSERQLAAQTARIGVATADLYPRFSLTGTFGFSATSGSRALRSDSRQYSFGPSVFWNIFDGGRVMGAIQLEEALTEQNLHSYKQTVLAAIEDVENSMISYTEEIERRDALGRSVIAATDSVKLAQILYKNGLIDFQNVLDMERSLFNQQDALAKSEGLVIQNLIRIYKALGGGWPTTVKTIESAAAADPRAKINN
jgi:NodT family efflux transporter outer membrane factor (OMF) lipoprotein